jgi:2-phospho-L-lactate/phosphoenolpyruvate guanylyltransferase
LPGAHRAHTTPARTGLAGFVVVAASYVILLPVKSPGIAKSRLAGVGEQSRRLLAMAFAEDTIAAARATRGVTAVVVATDDAEVEAQATAAGCLVVPDAGELNDTLRAAAAAARSRWPAATPVALCSDLPALRSEDLESALAATPRTRPGFVADADGSGTTMYAASYDGFAPAFGPGSAAAHRSGGALEVTPAAAGLRLDVDDPDDLARALALGVGTHTARVLDSS